MSVEIYPEAPQGRLVDCKVQVVTDVKTYSFQWSVETDDFVALFPRLMERAQQEILEAVKKEG